MSSLVQLLIASMRAPLHFLPLFRSPLICPSTTSMRHVGRAFRAIRRWIAILRILAHKVLEDNALLSWFPESAKRKIPTSAARLVATIETACLAGVPLAIRALVSATILENYQSPCGASIAICSGTGTWLIANNSPTFRPGIATRLPSDTPTK